jgi:hypothetical protein
VNTILKQTLRKTSLNLPENVVDKVADLANRLHLTNTQVYRESIELRHYLQKEIDDGGQLVVERRNGDRVKLWLTGMSGS